MGAYKVEGEQLVASILWLNPYEQGGMGCELSCRQILERMVTEDALGTATGNSDLGFCRARMS